MCRVRYGYSIGVKHLNPRQGITTWSYLVYDHRPRNNVCETPKSPPGDYNRQAPCRGRSRRTVSCETPKSPPGDYNRSARAFAASRFAARVKHLNPRQGITTAHRLGYVNRAWNVHGVKHLNPRQGITTFIKQQSTSIRRGNLCETPKSPPGDYNKPPILCQAKLDIIECETPKSPPGDYNLRRVCRGQCAERA